jgi:flagella basal body P-ring formation protein FlgA
MMRFIALAFAACLAVVPGAAAQMLRPDVTVDAAVVRIGDILAQAGSHSNDAVVAAPPPGMRITYDSDWLAAMAREHELDWRPNAYDQVTIVRASRVIDANVIQAQLMKEIAAQVPIDGAQLRLDNPDISLVIAKDARPDLAIDGLTVDPRSGAVSAYVSAPAGDPAAERQRVTARLVYHIAVPVLNHAMGPGAVIAASDVETLQIQRNRVGTGIATDAQQLIGKSPRRPLEPGMPLQLGDLALPILVHKGELVTIILETPSLQLTAQGKALEDGAKDALVRVANTKSDRVIDAVVTAPGMAIVSLPGASIPTETALR